VFLHLGLHVVAYLVVEQIGISLCCTTMLFTSEIFVSDYCCARGRSKLIDEMEINLTTI
jgi:hypothetical protein